MTAGDRIAIIDYIHKLRMAFPGACEIHRSRTADFHKFAVLPDAWFDALQRGVLVSPNVREYPNREAMDADAVDSHPGIKPFPEDQAIIVAARAGEADLTMMLDIHHCECRDCGQKLHADTFSVATMERHPTRNGRPIKFLCRDCILYYRMNHVLDLRNRMVPA